MLLFFKGGYYVKRISNFIAPIFFICLGILCYHLAGVSPDFLFQEVYTRFIRNILFVVALILPILAGMGINFAITVGAIAAQIAVIVMIDFGVSGFTGVALTFGFTIVLSVIFGNLIGWLFNKAIGKEMILSIVIGLLATGLYQFLFMVSYGLFFQPKNPDILLDRSIGVRNMLDAGGLKQSINHLGQIQVFGDTEIAILPLLIIILCSAVFMYLYRTRLGLYAKGVGDDLQSAGKLGIDTKNIRRQVIVISTIFAGISQILFIANLGSVNVYAGHLHVDTFAAASILVGGATLKRANLKNAILGTILFHMVFSMSPMAGQTLFNNLAVGEYFRSFIAYGTIIFALIMNLKSNNTAGKLSE